MSAAEYEQRQAAIAREEDAKSVAMTEEINGLDFSTEALHQQIFGDRDPEEERCISMLIETAEALHRRGLMSEEDLNEMKRIGGRL